MKEPASILLVLFCTLLPIEAGGQDRTVDFEQLRAEALQLSPDKVELDATVLQRASEALAVSAFENPDLDVEIRPEVGGGDSQGKPEVEISIAQPLTVASFGARARVAALIRNTADLERKQAMHELSQSVRLLYGRAWIEQEHSEKLGSLLNQTRSTMERTKQASAQGLLARSGTKALEGQLARLDIERQLSRSDSKRALAQLTRMTRRDLLEARLAPIDFNELPRTADFIEQSSIPVQARLAARSRLIAAQQELARRDAQPKFVPRLGYERTAEESNLVTLGISVGLPVWQQNQAAIQQANAAKYVSDRAEEYATSAAFEAELRILLDVASESSASHRAYRERVLPALEQAFASAQAEFVGGQAPPNQVFQILAELTDAYEEYVDVWTKALSERVELSVLVGSEL